MTGRRSSRVTLLMPQRSLLLPMAAPCTAIHQRRCRCEPGRMCCASNLPEQSTWALGAPASTVLKSWSLQSKRTVSQLVYGLSTVQGLRRKPFPQRGALQQGAVRHNGHMCLRCKGLRGLV